MSKIFALIDCDSFFVSCEQAENPVLKGKPVCVIGGVGGCILSRSKEAKKMGIPMGHPCYLAKRDFKGVTYIDSHHEIYREYSKRVMAVLKEFSPNVEICSIDEGFVDFTGLCNLYKTNYYGLAKMLRQRILDEVDIPVSIGVSTTKLLAKFASDYAKNTGGIFLIGKSKLKKLLPKTNIDEICGIGRRMKVALNKEGIITCQELVNCEDEWLKKKFSITTVELKHELLGESINKIKNIPDAPKSLQETSTFAPNTNNVDFLKNELNRHIKDACRKMRKHNGKTSQIGVMLKTSEFIVYSDKKSITGSTNSELEISKIAFELFDKIYNKNLLYRSTGVWLANLNCTENVQMGLFDEVKNEKLEKLSASIDRIEAKFGKNSIKTGFI